MSPIILRRLRQTLCWIRGQQICIWFLHDRLSHWLCIKLNSNQYRVTLYKFKIRSHRRLCYSLKKKKTSNVFRFRVGVGDMCFCMSAECAILDSPFPCNSMFCPESLKELVSLWNLDFRGSVFDPLSLD